MKLLVLSLIAALALCAGQAKPTKKQAKAAATKKKVVVKPQVPKGARQTGPDTWSYTDEKGENWIYRRTPFGITRLAAPPATAPTTTETAADLPAGMKAVQAGEVIQFERPGPFGPARWTKKPDQLTDVERRVWERDRPKPEGAADPKDTGNK